MANAVNKFCALCEATGTYLQLSNVSPPMMQQQVENLIRNMERFRHRPEAHDPRVLVAIQRLPNLPVEEKSRMVLRMSEISGEAAMALTGNGNFQDWTSWPWFITDVKCAELRALNNQAERLLGVVAMPYKVGLRSPSEATLQALTAVHLTIHGLVDLDSHHKKAALDEIKNPSGVCRRIQWRIRLCTLQFCHRDQPPFETRIRNSISASLATIRGSLR